ncbi:MAG: MerR family transcriptional regulator [Clostridia bacterium]|nr:MerR family transcriptional regulator [Clostridia bacterium]
MTIKEMEARTGLTRANIRFYEAEGLITPERRPNGYRDYSEEDLAVLQRVKLLRSLHMSLEEIKAVHAGDRTLGQALDQHLVQLEQDQAGLERSKRVCQVMQGDGVSYETLDAPRYLEELERAAQGPPGQLDADQLPRVKAPWRRFFARNFDLFLYSTLMELAQIVLDIGMGGGRLGLSLSTIAVSVLMMYLLEPAFLSKWGTTPGKAILGLSVTNLDGSRLTLADARARTGLVLIRGMGFCIPVYQWIRNYKCYENCVEGKPLDWESDSSLDLKDTKNWRILVILFLELVLTFALSGVQGAAEPPHHTGDITVAEFCENFNDLADFHGYDLGYTLDGQGNWVESPKEEGEIILWADAISTMPIFTFREENGVMTGLTYTIEGDKGTVSLVPYRDHMTLALLAFVSAQEYYWFFSLSDPLDEVMGELAAPMPQVNDYQFGIRIVAQSEWETQEDQARVVFGMEKVG